MGWCTTSSTTSSPICKLVKTRSEERTGCRDAGGEETNRIDPGSRRPIEDARRYSDDHGKENVARHGHRLPRLRSLNATPRLPCRSAQGQKEPLESPAQSLSYAAAVLFGTDGAARPAYTRGVLLRTDRAARACYRTDGGQIVYGFPDAVVHARCPEDVADVLRLAQHDRIPVTCRGGGLTTEGESVSGAGILLDVKGMNRLIDCDGATAWVEAGMTWYEVAAALRPLGLDYTSAPLNLLSTVGGTLGVGGIDVNSPRHGCAADQAVELEVVTPTGEIVRVKEGRRVPGARAARLRAVRRHHEGADQSAPVPPDDGASLPVHRRRRRARRHDAPRRAGRRGGLRHSDPARRRRRADSGIRGGAGRLSAEGHLGAADHGDGRLPLRRASVALARCRLSEAASGGATAVAARPALRP